MDFNFYNKAIASISVCAVGTFSMYMNNGNVGIGWITILVIAIIWRDE